MGRPGPRVTRQTVNPSQYPDLVVIYLGMRLNSPRGIGKLIRTGRQIADMPLVGMAQFAEVEKAHGRMFSARARLSLGEAPAPVVSEESLAGDTATS